MADKTSYGDRLTQNLGSVIDTLEVSDIQRQFLRTRWLDQVLWMESKADRTRRRYYALRSVAVLGGVVVPTLVSLNPSGTKGDVVRALTIGISLIVALSVAAEELVRFGERYRHYRRTVELLKSEGWQFFQMSGPYRRHANHGAAYMSFAARVEGIIQPSVDVYVSQVIDQKEETNRERVDVP